MLAQLYHAHHNRHSNDLPFWLKLAARQNGPILELGCGTGRVLIALARAGYPAYGLDHDAEMLTLLQLKAGSDPASRCHFFQADMAAFHLARLFSLILLPCNTLSTLPTGTRHAALTHIRQHLSPNGLFAASLPEPGPPGPPAAAGGYGSRGDFPAPDRWRTRAGQQHLAAQRRAFHRFLALRSPVARWACGTVHHSGLPYTAARRKLCGRVPQGRIEDRDAVWGFRSVSLHGEDSPGDSPDPGVSGPSAQGRRICFTFPKTVLYSTHERRSSVLGDMGQDSASVGYASPCSFVARSCWPSDHVGRPNGIPEPTRVEQYCAPRSD